MKPKNITFNCHASDWHLARTYSSVSISAKDFSDLTYRWYVTPLLVFLISAIGSLLHMNVIWVIGIIISFPLFLINYQRQYTKYYQDLVNEYHFASQANQHIPYLSLDSEYIYCHFFKTDGSTSHKINLVEIQGFAVNTLSVNLNKFYLPILINNKAREAGAEVVPEVWKDKDFYILWIYTKSFVMRRESIAIPKEWLNDSTAVQFFKMLEQATGKKIEFNT